MENGILLFFLCAIILVALALITLRRHSAGESLSAEAYRSLMAQNEEMRRQLNDKEQELRQAVATLSAKEAEIGHLRELLAKQRAEQSQTVEKMQLQFRELANRILEEKSRSLAEQGVRQIKETLQPLRDKIREFEENIEQKFSQETRDKAGLKKEIEQLISLNQQLSLEARNLAAALKGQSKVQGAWGEYQLEVLLENAGLQKNEHFIVQATLKDEDGKTKRPDYIIRLPQKRHLIVDAKVTLTAYERYFNEEDPRRREQHLREHVESVRRHVYELSKKRYQMLEQVHTPDFVLMYIPLDGALSVALQADPDLLKEALEANVAIVTTSTLIVILQTITYLWRQEKQNRSALEIARQSGLLYDKLAAFVEDLRTVGARLDGAQEAYAEAMRKLSTGARRGDTLLGRAERIRQLGAKTTRQLPSHLIEEAEEESPET